MSLVRRAYYAAFMAGAGGLISEAGAVNFFYENTTAEGVFPLSPLGQVGSELYHFTHPPGGPEVVRGIPYVPVAVVVELDHGMGLGWWYQV